MSIIKSLILNELKVQAYKGYTERNREDTWAMRMRLGFLVFIHQTFKNTFLFIYMCMPECFCILHVCKSPQRSVISDSLELELQMVVSCHVGAWN